MIKYIEGNIVEVFKTKQYNCMLHQANCQIQFDGFKRHGAGVARSIAQEFPEMVYAENKALLENPQDFYFGGLFSHEQYENCHIVNLFSQYYFGSPNTRKIVINNPLHIEKYDNLRCRSNALRNALEIFKVKFGIENTVLIPLIASGIAKDSMYRQFDDLEYFKKIIEPIIIEHLKDYNVTVVVYKP
jgi:hypothetical protein